MNPHLRQAFLIIGPVIAAAIYLLGPTMGLQSPAAMTAAVTALCAIWWCTEAIPIPVTSLLPFVIFPLAGVLDHKQLAAAYGDTFILLFLAGFMISRAAEKSQTHLRISHALMRAIGTDSHKRLVLGFLLASAFCSMWISNTATALIMLPIALAVLDEQKDAKLSVSLLLATAYGSSIGGIATIIGTPPNGVFVSIYQQQTHKTVDFLSWVRIGIPVSVLMLVACAVILTIGLRRGSQYQLANLGRWNTAQKRTLVMLVFTALAWVTRTAPFGGWAGLLHVPNANDATVGLASVVVMFFIRSGDRDDKGKPDHLLDWKTAVNIPWGVLLLFAGGLAIAQAFQSTGLARHIGQSLSVFQNLHPVLVVAIICTVVTFMTEVTSNTATTTLLMPILAAVAMGLGLDPAAYMIPAALSASCAFMLPVATPPNAIVFGTERVSILDMTRKGLWLNLTGIVIITAVCSVMIDRHAGLGTPPVDAPASADVQTHVPIGAIAEPANNSAGG